MSSILNKPVPNVNVPVLEPIPYQQIIPKLKTLTRNLAENTSTTLLNGCYHIHHQLLQQK